MKGPIRKVHLPANVIWRTRTTSLNEESFWAHETLLFFFFFVIDLKELESNKHLHAIVGKMDLTLGSWVLTNKSLRLAMWWLSWSWSSGRTMEPLRRKSRKCWIWWGYMLTEIILCNVSPWSSQTEIWLKRGTEVLLDSQQWSWMLWIHGEVQQLLPKTTRKPLKIFYEGPCCSPYSPRFLVWWGCKRWEREILS